MLWQGPPRHSPKEVVSRLRDREFWLMVGLFAGGVIIRQLRVWSQRPWFQSWLFTYSVTLLVSELSVPRLPVLGNEAHNWIVTKTTLVYTEFFAPG